jgi:heme/copper-type cytochrome/quinol oxidase subunit 2
MYSEILSWIHCSYLLYDAPDVWQFRFQDPASSSMEGILLFNKHILFVITVIVLLVTWILIQTILSYNAFSSSNSTEFYHDNDLEIV